MSDKYEPNSINAVLSRIESTQKEQGATLIRIEDNQTQLWKAHSNLRTKVAAVSAGIGIFLAFAGEWLKSIFTDRK